MNSPITEETTLLPTTRPTETKKEGGNLGKTILAIAVLAAVAIVGYSSGVHAATHNSMKLDYMPPTTYGPATRDIQDGPPACVRAEAEKCLDTAKGDLSTACPCIATIDTSTCDPTTVEIVTKFVTGGCYLPPPPADQTYPAYSPATSFFATGGTFTGSTTGGTATGPATGGTFTGSATGGTATGPATGGTATGPATGGTNTGSATGGTNTGSATGGTNTGSATGGTNTGSATGGTFTGSATGGTFTGSATGGTATGGQAVNTAPNAYPAAAHDISMGPPACVAAAAEVCVNAAAGDLSLACPCLSALDTSSCDAATLAIVNGFISAGCVLPTGQAGPAFAPAMN